MRWPSKSWLVAVALMDIACTGGSSSGFCFQAERLGSATYSAEVVEGPDIWDVTVEVQADDRVYIHWTDADGTHTTQYEATIL